MKEHLPMDIEITQGEEHDKSAIDALNRLQSAEDGVTRAFKELAERMEKANKERERFYQNQREMERQYIQLTQRKSTLITNMDLQVLKEHLKRSEESVNTHTQIAIVLKEMGDGYAEYNNALKDLLKVWSNLGKTEADWRKAGNDFRKAMEEQDGNKLEKLEKEIIKRKSEVVKAFQDKAYRWTFVEKAMVRINQTWQKLKNSVKNVGW
jgi:hypothetical protein